MGIPESGAFVSKVMEAPADLWIAEEHVQLLLEGGDPGMPLRPFSLPLGCSCPPSCPPSCPWGPFQEGGSKASNLHILKGFFFLFN